MNDLENLGIYSDFPKKTHYVGYLKTNVSIWSFKKGIIESLISLNKLQDNTNTFKAGQKGLIKANRSFEVGIADGLNFNFLDIDECKRVRKWVSNLNRKQIYSPLDFILFIHYRQKSKKTGRNTSLRFDQYFLRFNFNKPIVLFHRKSGLMRSSPEDILILLTGFLNKWLQKEIGMEYICKILEPNNYLRKG